MSEESSSEELITIMTLGKCSVGKSSFILRFTENRFENTYLTTVGLDFRFRLVNIKDIQYKVLFYDTVGQEKYHSIAPNIIKKANGIIIMYDITNKSTFDSIREIIESINEEKGKDFPMILIGNKIDLENEREIKKEEAEELAEKYGMEFFEISNKEGINIEKAGLSIVKKILEKRQDDSNIETNESSRPSDGSYHSKYSNIDNDGSNRNHCC
jgi:small GTP-binding protein